MTSVTFLGTGNFLAPGRYWNSFVLDGRILVEPSPTALPHLRRCGISARDIDVIVISHFHADHTFGWPFLLFEIVKVERDRPLFVVGPPGVDSFLAEMMRAGSVPSIHIAAHDQLDIRYVEVDGSWQEAGPLRFRAIEVDHVPYLRCFGYAFDRGDRTIGYSGDTRPCPGLDELVAACDALILECNGPHPPPPSHMDRDSVLALRQRFPDVPFVLTHVGESITAEGIPHAVLPDDFETVEM